MGGTEYEGDPGKWSKRTKLNYLLDHWSDIFQPNIYGSLSGSRGGSDAATLLPFMAHDKSVVQLAGLLDDLAKLDPQAYRHLKAFRCNVEWRQVKARIKFLGPTGRMLEGTGWKRERIVPRWISEARVNFAEDWLERHFEGEVYMPPELWGGLTKVAGG